MMTDWTDVNPHRALWASETYVSPVERKWEKWVDATARLMGLKSLDGDQDADGYSLDYALMLFEADYTPAEAVTEFRAGTFKF
jgi:hypothetical protein